MGSLEQHKADQLEKAKAKLKEPYQVVVSFKQTPFLIRITYSNPKSERIISLEELDSLEAIKTSCKFRGKSYEGTCDYLKELRSAIQGMKPSDWEINEGYVESYYKQH